MRRDSKWISAFAALALMTLTLHAQHPAELQEWLTTPDRSSLIALQPDSPHFEKVSPSPPVIQIDESKTYQTIDGFGFALTGGSAQLMMKMSAAKRSALIHELMGPGKDEIGVSYLRVSIGASDMNGHVYSYEDLPEGVTDSSLARFDLGPDKQDIVPVLQEILKLNPKIKILASPWSPPPWMKSNNNVKAGSLKPEYYEAYAQYFVKYIQAMHTEGIPIDAITVQNEPLNEKNTPSLVLPAAEEAAFIKQALGPAFRKAKITTKIILYDHNCDVPEYPESILADSQAAQYVDGSGYHLYAGEIAALTHTHDAYPTKNVYFTEQMVVNRFFGKDHDESQLHIAEPIARIVIGATRNWSKNVLLWNLAADPQLGPHTSNGGCPVCQGAITLDGDKVTRNLAWYTIAQVSKFVPPGSVRIESQPSASLPNVAFKTPNGKIVLIVANPSEKPQTFGLQIANQEKGKLAESTLPAGSAATYVW